MVMAAALLPGPGSATSQGRQGSSATASVAPAPVVKPTYPTLTAVTVPVARVESVPTAAPRRGDAPRPPIPAPTNRPASAVRSAPRAVPAVSPPGAVAPSAVAPSGPGTTLATHYGPRPATCWDPGRSTHVPAPGEPGYDPRYTAAHFPCGTTLEVSGPAGSVTIQVWDHGPWGDPARGLDLSPAAFLAVVGPLGIGVATVRWQVVG